MDEQKATLTDWVWVQSMVMQAMVGCMTPEVGAVGLSERADEWIVTFFLRHAVSDDIRQDLIQVGGDAAAFLDECDAEKIHASSAIHRPIRTEILEDAPRLINVLLTKVDRLLLAQSPE